MTSIHIYDLREGEYRYNYEIYKDFQFWISDREF